LRCRDGENNFGKGSDWLSIEDRIKKTVGSKKVRPKKSRKMFTYA
jgi:hypothetical protein